MRYIRVWIILARAGVMRQMEYRINVALTGLEALGRVLIAVLTFTLLYRYTNTIAGWSRADALLLVGIYTISDGLFSLFLAPSLRQAANTIRTGDLDALLLRPVSSQFLVSARTIDPAEVTTVLIGCVLSVLSGNAAGSDWTVLQLGGAIIVIACGLALMYAWRMVLVTLSFWLSYGFANPYRILDGLTRAGAYPITIFKQPMRWALTYVIPIGFIATFPSEALRGTLTPEILPAGLALTAVALVGSHRLWEQGLRRYSSASS